jgi:hypothetical protein
MNRLPVASSVRVTAVLALSVLGDRQEDGPRPRRTSPPGTAQAWCHTGSTCTP